MFLSLIIMLGTFKEITEIFWTVRWRLLVLDLGQ